MKENMKHIGESGWLVFGADFNKLTCRKESARFKTVCNME
jgi:hypothetical protein